MYRAGPKTLDLNNKLVEMMEMQHIDPQIGRSLKERLKKLDELTNVTTTFISCPGGQWAGKVKRMIINITIILLLLSSLLLTIYY